MAGLHADRYTIEHSSCFSTLAVSVPSQDERGGGRYDTVVIDLVLLGVLQTENWADVSKTMWSRVGVPSERNVTFTHFSNLRKIGEGVLHNFSETTAVETVPVTVLRHKSDTLQAGVIFKRRYSDHWRASIRSDHVTNLLGHLPAGAVLSSSLL